MSLDVQRLVALGRVTAFDLSPDGSWLAVEVGRSDEEGNRYRPELWRVPLDGSEPTRLGAGRFQDGSPRFRADGALLFTSNRSQPDHGPDDAADAKTRPQVWAQLPDGKLVRLTDEPLGILDFKVADSGRLVVLTRVLPGIDHALQRPTADDRKKSGPSLLHYREMPVRFWDHWLEDARVHFVRLDRDGTRIDLTPDADREYESQRDWDLSADGRTLATVHSWTGELRVPLGAVALIDVESGDTRIVGKEEGAFLGSLALSPDGASLASVRGTLTRDKGVGRHAIEIVDVASGEGQMIAGDWDRWPMPADWIDAGTVLCACDDAGAVALYAVDLKTGERRSVAPRHTWQAPMVRGQRIYAIRHGLLEPPEVVSVPAEGGKTTWHTALAGIDRAELAELAAVEMAEIPATDGASVPLFVVRPKNSKGAYPGLLWIHGGPIGQWADGWHWRWNALIAVAAGYVVGLPNPRGSTGLGQEFIEGIWGNQWGAQCYEDVIAAADAFVSRPDVDERRTCAMGGSFGGYMTNWIGTKTDRFQCLITHASVFSYQMFGWTTDLPAWWQITFRGSPWADREEYERYSPDIGLPNWKSPVLIIHGEKDYRVPVSEGLALFEGLVQHEVDAELAIFPDENHWILKPRNVVAWYELVLDYLDRKLRGR